MTIFGYARVSTDGQTLDAQLEALKAAGCEKMFQEKISGAQADRPQLARLLKAIRSGDTLIVTRLDRLARSTRDLLNILGSFTDRGVAFRSLRDQWADTTTAHGRLMLTILGGLAEFERDLIAARTGEGRARAKARGVHMGRPSKLTAHQWREARAELAAGTSTRADLARRFNVSHSTIARFAEKALRSPAPSAPAIDATTAHAARVFMQRISDRYPVADALLYGSRARGTHRPDSDADLAVILKGERGDRSTVASEFAAVEFHVMMETGILVQGMPLWESEVARPETFNNPTLIANILREGVHL